MQTNHDKSMVLAVVLLSAYVSSMPQTTSLDTQVMKKVRLVGGDDADSGHLEVLVNGVWGYVCSSMFDDYDAKVVCRQLGYQGDAFAYRDGRYGPVTGSHHLTQLDCTGEEQYLEDCPANATAQCSQGHASLSCFNNNGIVDAALEKILPKDCGRPVDAREQYITRLARVRDGANINRFETPWVATLFRESKGDDHICGAVVLSEDYLLTAAHCLDNMWLPDFIVRVGEHNRDIDDSQHQSSFLNKQYSTLFTLYVMGVQEIIYGKRFNERVQPICLPKTGTQYQDRRKCTLTGWGRQHYILGSTRKRLSATINMVPISACDEAYRDVRHTSSIVCAAPESGKLDNPCAGDSGSPLTCQVEAGTSTLMGLVSTGKPCGFSNEFPDKYTRVEKYLRWILINISNNS
ncbi:unnamed protein product, partial [Meganyctiphanes norvegica]